MRTSIHGTAVARGWRGGGRPAPGPDRDLARFGMVWIKSKRLIKDQAKTIPIGERRMARQLGAAVIGICLLLWHSPTRGQTVVADCTEQAFRAALNASTNVSFNEDCTITLSGPVNIQTNVFIDADGHNVTLAGASSNGLFSVASNVSFTLSGVTLNNGQNTNGGALYIQAGAAVRLTNCTFSGNSAIGTNGATGKNGGNGSTGGGNGSGGSAGAAGLGGAIYNLGDLSIFNCQFLTNTVVGGDGGNGGNGGSGSFQGGNGGGGANGGMALGGGIYNLGMLHLENSAFSGNAATGGNAGAGGAGGSGASPGLTGGGGRGGIASGAGLYTFRTNSVTILNCTFSGNTASGGNSAAAGAGSISGGSGHAGANASGGGICNVGTLAVTNSTFFQNAVIGGNGGAGGPGSFVGGNGGAGGSGVGGGLYNTGTVYVVNCTFSSGSAVGGTNGAGGAGGTPGSNGSKGKAQGGNFANTNGVFTLQNSIIATNFSGGGGYGSVIDAGNNLSADRSVRFTSATSKTNTDPMLGPFADNGGPTLTLALLTNSPALNQIAPTNAPAFDQRGAPRPYPTNGLSDIGAYEEQPLFIQTQPVDQTQTNGGTVMFTVSAIGDSPLQFQWQFNGTTVGTNETYPILNVAATNQGNYDVIISDSSGSVTSAVVTLMVNFAPSITAPPTNQMVLAGSPVSFSVTAAGTQPLAYQWQFNGANISGATNAVYSIPALQAANAGTYAVAITNAFGSITSAPAILSLGVPPSIITQPASQTVAAGSNVVFGVIATGTPTLAYQWRFAGTNLLDANGPTYSRSSVQKSDAGNYDVVVSNSFGTVDSAIATLAVSAPSPSIAQPALVSTSFSFAFQTEAGFTYVVQYKNTLADPNWIPLSTNSGTGGWLTNFDSATNAPSRFYRILVE